MLASTSRPLEYKLLDCEVLHSEIRNVRDILLEFIEAKGDWVPLPVVWMARGHACSGEMSGGGVTV